MTFYDNCGGPHCDECLEISMNEWHDIFMMNAVLFLL